jgi:hypothetical protein
VDTKFRENKKKFREILQQKMTLAFREIVILFREICYFRGNPQKSLVAAP